MLVLCKLLDPGRVPTRALTEQSLFLAWAKFHNLQGDKAHIASGLVHPEPRPYTHFTAGYVMCKIKVKTNLNLLGLEFATMSQALKPLSHIQYTHAHIFHP